ARYCASRGHPSLSPSGQYQLNVRLVEQPDELHYEFDICRVLSGTKIQKVYTLNKTFSPYHSLVCAWDPKDRVWIYSGDFGHCFLWTVDTEGTWCEQPLRNSPAPAVLNRLLGGTSFILSDSEIEEASMDELAFRLHSGRIDDPKRAYFDVEHLSEGQRNALIEEFKQRLDEASHRYGREGFDG